MKSLVCSMRLTLACALLFPACLPCLQAQIDVLSVRPIEKFPVQRGEIATLKLTAELRPGFHVNSNTPLDDYLIPLKLTWAGGGTLDVQQIAYPQPQMEKYDFSQGKPVSVFSGRFEIATRFKAAAGAANGPGAISGKLRYQACNQKECLPPRTIDVKIPVFIR